MANAVRTRLAELDEGQAAEVLRALLARIEDRPPAATEDELATQREEDEAFLATLTNQVGIHRPTDGIPAGDDPARTLLLAIYDSVPDIRPAIDDALNTAALTDETLDFGLTALVAVLVVAVGAAIMRPRVTVATQKDGTKKKKKKKKTTTTVEIRGVQDIGKVLQAILPFLDR